MALMRDRSATSDVPPSCSTRPLAQADHAQWLRLWHGYNAFYGRSGDAALKEQITNTTWRRFFSPGEPVRALVAELDGAVVGIAHYLFHRSTSRLTDVCYLQDLFTDPDSRGRGVGRSLIAAVYQAAQAAGSDRVYWQTQSTNETGRRLYDKMAEHKGFIVYSHEVEGPDASV